MKRIHKTIALTLLLAVAGCTKNGPNAGSEINFSVSSRAVSTRTAYEGSVTGTAPNQKERINWIAGDAADQIRVYCAKCTTNAVDYKIANVTATSETVSSATLTPATGTGMIWADYEDHTFFAMYPAPAMMGSDEEDFTMSATSASWKIPATQAIVRKGETSLYYPDMHYATMVARTTANPLDASVNLAFQPAFTAYEFSIEAGDNDAVHLTSFTLSTGVAGAALAGKVNAAATVEETPVADYPLDADGYRLAEGTGSASISVDFTGLTGGNLTLTRSGGAVSFSILALPMNGEQLTITLTGTEIGTRTLALTDNANNWITFTRCKKHRIQGLSFPKIDEFSATGGDIHWNGAVGEELYWHGATGEDITWKN